MKRYESEFTCALLAAVCLLLGLLLRTVFTAVRFTGFLLCCAAAALAVLGLLCYWSRRSRAGRVCKRAFLGLLAAGFLFFAVLEVWVISQARTDRETPVTAMIVFGAGVNGTVPSLSLQRRLEAALAYIEGKPGEDFPIVVSGCRGRGEDISEARCMADWLTARGVPAERVLLEERAANTEENIRYSLALLSERGVDVTAPIAFCSSDYHICRVVYLYGGDNAVPVAAPMPARYWPLTLNYYIREAFGMAAALVF